MADREPNILAMKQAFSKGRVGRVVVRKWKREAEKGDNEGRETQIGQNNILVGRFV